MVVLDSLGVLPPRGSGLVSDGHHRGTLGPHVLMQSWPIEEALRVATPTNKQEVEVFPHVAESSVGVLSDNSAVCVVPPQSWGDRSDTKHLKCLLLGGWRLNQLTLIPKPKGSGGARAAMAQVGPANKRDDTKRCLPIEASLRPGEAIPW